MLIPIKKDITFTNRKPFDLEIPKEIKKRVNLRWQEFIKDRDGYWDGDIYTATEIYLDKYIIEIAKTKYSNLIYSKETNELAMHSLFVSILLQTTDNKYLIIKSNHGNINIIGGMVDKRDFDEGQFRPEHCLKREIKEEIGLDLYNKEHIRSYKMKYLKVPNNKENYYPVGIVYTAMLNFSSSEFNEYMRNNDFDGEIVEWYFYKPEECLNLNLTEEDIEYLKELINLEN